jgi:hypothetical protein
MPDARLKDECFKLSGPTLSERRWFTGGGAHSSEKFKRPQRDLSAEFGYLDPLMVEMTL